MINHDQYTEPIATDDEWDDELADSAKHIGAIPYKRRMNGGA